MVSVSQVTSREGWTRGWVKDCGLSAGFLTAGAPVYVAGTYGSGVELPEALVLGAGFLLYVVTYALIVLVYALVDERFSPFLPPVIDPTPNFRAGLIPAAVVVPSFLGWALLELTLSVDSESVSAVLWVIGGNVLGFSTCLVLVHLYGGRYNPSAS